MDRTEARILMDQLGMLRQRKADLDSLIEGTCEKLKGYMDARSLEKLKGLSFEGQLVDSSQPVWNAEAIEALARKAGVRMSRLRSYSPYTSLRTQKI